MIRSIALGIWIIGLQAGAVSLEEASNFELLNEVSRRMGTDPSPALARALYTCNSSGTLELKVTGTETSESDTLFTGSYDNCTRQMATLSRLKSRLRQNTLVAACNSSGSLYRYTFLTTGKIAERETTFTGSFDNCMRQAQVLNESARR